MQATVMFRHLITFMTIWLLSVEGASDTNYKLSTPIIPSSYSIVITPFFDTGDNSAFRFDGEVSIKITTQESVNRIQLHSEDLVYNSTDITVTTGTTNVALNVSNPLEFVETYRFVYINLATELQVNVEYTVTIKYNGPIRDDLNGLYRNYYYENGVKKWLAATQLETTSARKVFPCLDEPAYKAVFTLTIDRPPTYKPSLANTKLQNTVTLANGYVRETFYPTPKMSTYLVAFLVSEFEAAQYANGTREFSVFTRPEARDQALYAFDFGTRVVDALSNYLQIDYYSVDSNLKLDHIALIDFRAGAMENWGLIKYREALLLYVPEVSTPYYKYRVAQIVAHETTHMWFGNLVTCHWWSNTWLNEGFANYFQDYITSLIEPEVGSADMLVTGSVYDAYSADETPNAPAITNEEVNSPAEISGHFGTISYQKAGSVIRMIHNLIGDNAFKYGLNAYLNANIFDVGVPEKMYSALHEGVLVNNALSAYPGITIADLMSSWVSQAGHPVLHVDVDYEEEIITLNQKRFYIDSDNQSNETYKIPITYTTQSSPNFNDTKPLFILQDKELELNVSGLFSGHEWIIVNVQETGFYRVNYDDHSWTMIGNALKGDQREVIHNLNRAKIVNDLFAFVYADLVKFDTLYEVLDFLTNETDFSVWYATISGLNKLRNSYLGTDALDEIESYALRVLEPIVEKLGYETREGDDFVTLRNRMQLLEFACKIGHKGCTDNAVESFRKLRENGTEISPSLRPVAYCIGLRYGDGDDYNFLWERMSTTNVANEARIIADALGCTDVEDKLQEYLVSMLKEDSPIRTQDLTVPLTSTLAHYNHVHLVLHALQQNYTVWSTIYPSIDTILTIVASALRTQTEFNEFESWLDSCLECSETSVTSAKAALAQAKRSAEWAQEHKSDILRSLGNGGVIASPSLIILVFGLLSAIFLKF